MTTVYTVTLLDQAVANLQRLEELVIEREFASEMSHWETPQQPLDALREGMRLLSWSP